MVDMFMYVSLYCSCVHGTDVVPLRVTQSTCTDTIQTVSLDINYCQFPTSTTFIHSHVQWKTTNSGPPEYNGKDKTPDSIHVYHLINVHHFHAHR